MGKRVFWIFLLIVVALTTIAVIYIQSEPFARIVRTNLQVKLAKDLGVELNFDRVKIGILPPSISLSNVDLKVTNPKNRLGLSPQTVFKAASLGFSFRMIQAFSNGIAINKVFISDGTIKLQIPKSTGSHEPSEKLSALVHKPIKIQINDNFFASIRQLELRNTLLDLSWDEAGHESAVLAKQISYLALTPSSEGTNIVLNAEDFEINTPKVKESIRTIKLDADIQKNLVLLSSLDVQRRDAALHAAGKLVGSIDTPQDARPDVDIILRAPMQEFSDFSKDLASFQGDIYADAKIVGRIKDPALQGKVEISNFKHGLWSLEKVEVSGSFAAGLLVVDSFNVNHAGGKISLKNKLELNIPFKPEPAAFQLHLEKAKFEDLAGDLRKSVNNLKVQMDGVIKARLDFITVNEKVKLNSLTLNPDINVQELELNNQAYGKTRKYKRIFKLAPFQLSGNVAIKNGDLNVTETKATFGSGVLHISGHHTARTGFDLSANAETFDLGKELGELAEAPVTGHGSLGVHVRGGGDDVKIDFDIDQENLNIVHFNLGKASGRITYEDKNNLIVVPNVVGNNASAAYKASGKVDVGDKEDIELKVSFDDSAPDDLFGIFQHQLQKITWLPKGMTGTIRGSATVGGKYTNDLDSLEIGSHLSGRNLSYRGEIFHELEADAGVTKGKIYGRNVNAKKYDTPYHGSIDYDLKSDELRYKLDTDRGKLRGLDFFTNAGVPVEGLYELHSEGHGKWETLISKTKFDVSNAFVRTRPIPPVTITYDTTAESSAFSAKLGPSATVTGQIAHSSKGSSNAHISLQRANLDFLLCSLSKANCNDGALAFTGTMEGKFTWDGWDWQALNGSGTIAELTLGKTGYSLHSPAALPVKAVNGLLQVGPGSLEGEDTKLSFNLRGRTSGAELSNSLHGNASLKILEFVTPLIEEARGHLHIDLEITGDSKNGIFRGGLRAEDGMLRLSGLDAPIENFAANLKLSGSHVTVENLSGDLGGGTVQASGGMELYLNRSPRFAVDLFLANNRIKFYPVNFAEISDGKLSFTGDAPPYSFAGTVKAKKVMMRDNFNLGRGQEGLQNAKYLPEKMGGAKSFYEVRIRALADNGIFVENNLLNAEFRGEVTLMNNFEFPQVVGRAELIQGKLLFRNTSFVLDHAFLRAANPEVFNPQFSLGGTTNVDNYRINIFASGTPDRPKITFSSDPALSQENIVSLLAFGYQGEDASKINPSDSAAITYSEVGSILLDQLQLSQDLQSKGLKVSVVPTVTETEEGLIHRNASTATAAPKVQIQSQVMKNLEATLGGTVGVSSGQTMDARLEYKLGRRTSVRGVYEQSPSAYDVTETKNSYGADLKFRWEFK